MMTNNLPLVHEVGSRRCRVETLQQLPSTPDLIMFELLKVCRNPAVNIAQDIAIMFITA
jgi:hypothetical protein